MVKKVENKNPKLSKYVAVTLGHLKRYGLICMTEKYHGRYFMTGGFDCPMMVITEISQEEFFGLLNEFSNYIERGSMHVVQDYKLPGSLDHTVLLTTK